jgi:hypothetical protein
MTNISVRMRSSGCMAASFGNVLIVQWNGVIGPTDVAELERTTLSLARETSGSVAHFNLAYGEGGTGLAEGARDALVQMVRRPELPLFASAVVHTQEGFSAAMVRSILSGLVLLSGSRFPIRMFASVGDAEGWIAEMLEKQGRQRFKRGDLSRAADELRVQSAAHS